MHACIEVSRCWPRPERSRSFSATTMSAAACVPACSPACGKPTGIGGRSGSPCIETSPPAAWSVRSVAGRCACGPVCPNGLIEA